MLLEDEAEDQGSVQRWRREEIIGFAGVDARNTPESQAVGDDDEFDSERNENQNNLRRGIGIDPCSNTALAGDDHDAELDRGLHLAIPMPIRECHLPVS